MLIMDARDSLTSPRALLNVAVVLGCSVDAGESSSQSVCNDSKNIHGKEGSAHANEDSHLQQQHPWLTWSCHSHVDCNEPVAIALRSGLLGFLSKDTFSPAMHGSDDYRSLSARLLAALKTMSGDRGMGPVASAGSKPSSRAADAAKLGFQMGVAFNTRAAVAAADAVPLILLPQGQPPSSAPGTPYRRLVKFGARVRYTRNTTDGRVVDTRPPQVTISSPRQGNYFPRGGGRVAVDVLNFWLPEEGSLDIGIDDDQIYPGVDIHVVNGRFELHLGAISHLSIGVHSINAILIDNDGEVVAEDMVQFGVF